MIARKTFLSVKHRRGQYPLPYILEPGSGIVPQFHYRQSALLLNGTEHKHYNIFLFYFFNDTGLHSQMLVQDTRSIWDEITVSLQAFHLLFSFSLLIHSLMKARHTQFLFHCHFSDGLLLSALFSLYPALDQGKTVITLLKLRYCISALSHFS